MSIVGPAICCFGVFFFIALLVALLIPINSKPNKMVTYGSFPDEDEETIQEKDEK